MIVKNNVVATPHPQFFNCHLICDHLFQGLHFFLTNTSNKIICITVNMIRFIIVVFQMFSLPWAFLYCFLQLEWTSSQCYFWTQIIILFCFTCIYALIWGITRLQMMCENFHCVFSEFSCTYWHASLLQRSCFFSPFLKKNVSACLGKKMSGIFSISAAWSKSTLPRQVLG